MTQIIGQCPRFSFTKIGAQEMTWNRWVDICMDGLLKLSYVILPTPGEGEGQSDA